MNTTFCVFFRAIFYKIVNGYSKIDYILLNNYW